MKEQALLLREQAKNQLLEIKTIDEAVDYVNKVKAIETYCKAVKEDNEIVKIVAEQKIRSMRLAGQMLQQTDMSSNIGSNQHVLPEDKPTLSQLGISKNESSTYQKIASIPEDDFEAEMTEAKSGDSTRDISVSRFKNISQKTYKPNQFIKQLENEKNLSKVAKNLGFKMDVLSPDIIILHKNKSYIEQIISKYNQNQ